MKNYTGPTKSRYTVYFYCLLVTLLISLTGYSQNVGINTTGTAPNAAAGLDVDFTNKGLLIPRIALTGTANFAPLSAHVAGMIVYNTATAGDVIPGFYYNNGTKWVSGFPPGTANGDMLYWNAGAWNLLPVGTAGQYLTLNGSNIPSWANGTIGGVYAIITTNAATLITGTTATSGAVITSSGGSTILSRGICYATTTGPTTADFTVLASPIGGTAPYSCNLTGLTPATTYYVRAYTINNSTVSYGNEISFTTLAVTPTLAATTAATLVTATTASSGGNVLTTGGAPILERGIVVNTAGSPTLITPNTIKVIDGAPGLGIFASNITGLVPGTMSYYISSYATNSAGTGYGAQTFFKTALSVTSTTAASAIGSTTATTGGVLAAFGTAGFAWKYGTAYSLTPNSASPLYADAGTYPTTAGLTYFTNLTGLTSNTTYYIRAYAETTYGVFSYGPELSFTTVTPTAPVVASTNAVTNVTGSSATSGGAITSDGGTPLTHKGVCWGTSTNPVIAIGTGNFTDDIATYPGQTPFVSSITGLTGNTAYYVRAYATNAINTSYGPVSVSFTTWVQSTHYLGEPFGGGTVAYIAPDGSGLIISPDIFPTTPATYFDWGCSGTMVGTGTAVGTGLANTNLIISTCGATTAAGIARAYTGGGFNDWFLPSRDEFGAMVQVPNIFGYNGSTNYFTSSELNIPTNPIAVNSTYAYTYTYYSNGLNGNVVLRTGTTSANAIKAVRSFGAPVAPTVFTTDAASAITATTATSGGNVTSDGGSPVSKRGVCWGTATNPTIALATKTVDGAGMGTFVSSITGLTNGILYHVRAYATNSINTSYGPEITFTAGVASTLPVVTTDPMGNLVGSVAEGNYTVLNENGVVSAAGLCFSTNANPTLLTSNTVILPDPFWATGMGVLGSLPLDMTGLTVGTLYHVRAYATNGPGSTGYGADVTFTATAATLGQSIYLNYQGGVVYSVTGGGAHGMIALNFNSGQPADWGCTNSVTGATGTVVGTGLANTTAILANILANTCVSVAPTLQFAAQMSQVGTEWYLPSKDEFTQLWNTVSADQILYAGLTFGLPLTPYWSSSEVNATHAWYFDGFSWVNTGLKSAQYNVWPIRSF